MISLETPLNNPFQFGVSSFSLSKPIKHGQTAHELWQIHGAIVRVLRKCFNSFFKQSSTVLINGWSKLVLFRKLRLITCNRCRNENFYIKIQTSLETEFLASMIEKFVCPKCAKEDEK
jgi:hypothetical protein